MNQIDNELLKNIEKLNFIRYGGTESEKKAANMIQKMCDLYGGTSKLESFNIPSYSIKNCYIKTVYPYKKEIKCVPYAFSKNLIEENELELVYLERGEETDYIENVDYSDKVVLLNELNYDIYERLVKHNVQYFIVIENDKWYNSIDSHDFVPKLLRPKMKDLGNLTGFIIRSCDALELIKQDKVYLKLHLDQNLVDVESQNVVATILGSDKANESIVLCAHYDSVLNGNGQWDNASGCSVLLYLYKYFLNHKTRRTLRFIWCGSEEQGLLGSKAYIQMHQDYIKYEIKLCINFDMVGTCLGHNKIFLAGKDDLIEFVNQFVNKKRYSTEIKTRIHSSDSASFNQYMIPSISICRGTKTAQIHSKFDLIDCLCEKQLKNNADFALEMIDELTNVEQFPISLGMNDKLNEALINYFEKYKKQP